jgi:ketosteroid isomerase-like protein
MMRELALGAAIGLGSITVLPATGANMSVSAQLNPSEHAALLQAREAVWRAWFTNNRAALEQVLPDDTIAIDNGEEKWGTRAAVLDGAAQFAAEGGRLLRLEFPRTEIQSFGDVAVLYSLYSTETETHGQRTVNSGRATEVFVRRDGRWLNVGWHLDSGK